MRVCWSKTNATIVFISMMRNIFIFGFAKKYWLVAKLGFCKVREKWFFGDTGSATGFESGSATGSLHRPSYRSSLDPVTYQVADPVPKNFHSSRTLQSRNFGSNKYFLANPKIKIIGIIETNTLVASILPYHSPQRRNRKKLHFL